MLAGTLGMVGYAAVAESSASRPRRATRARIAQTTGGAVRTVHGRVWLSLAAFKRHASRPRSRRRSWRSSPVLVIAIARIVHGEAADPRAWIGRSARSRLACLAFRDEIARAVGG
jgi:hypothetical protein